MELLPCPLCGKNEGYCLTEGSTYRWWLVNCNGCGRIIDECTSDRRIKIATKLPKKWDDADEVWNSAGEYAESLRAQLSAMQPTSCQCEACLSVPKHDSDCAVHNMPAYPNEPCNCSLSSADVLVEALREIANSSHSSAGGSRIANEALESYEAKLLKKEGWT